MPARASCDQVRRHIKGELRDELAILDGVFTRLHIAPAAPRFIADAPIFHAERFLIAVSHALVGQAYSTHRGIAIRDPILKLPGRTRTDVGCQIWLRSDQAAKPHELVNAELI